MKDFDKLGAFYLGKRYDLSSRAVQDDLLLYDSKDLTTHAVCVGMTGSGKTGLCLSLLEEAAIDGIPAIIIDPKGDMPNLALSFPKLDAASFLPWVDEGEATREGMTKEQYSVRIAERWKEGLKEWGQGLKRVRDYHKRVDIPIYTPGSNAGLPLTVLRSFAAPSAELLADSDAYSQRITSATSGLLSLLGVDADPVRDREHILVATLLDQAWRAGQDVNIEDLIHLIQDPPMEKIGVVALDKFYPQKDRTALAMQLNNLLASPSFSPWMQGESLDVEQLLTPSQDGESGEKKSRLSIISIAHLSQAERMFFVTILLNEVVSWMRKQPGTSSLRALLYMDEVFGFFPPVANPPSKPPMLTLLKQARAHGLGVVLATQNPADLDYKGLSNIGTWFLGRLQTGRDKERVLEGLEGAAVQSGSEFNRSKMAETLAGLGKRVFLMNNVHEDAPVTFHTRWAMSYLRGPMTRNQIKTLMDPRRPASPSSDSAASTTSGKSKVASPAAAATATVEGKKRPATRAAASMAAKSVARRKSTTTAAAIEAGKAAGPGAKDAGAEGAEHLLPRLPKRVDQRFLAADLALGEDERVEYRPALVAMVHLHYVRATHGIDDWQDCEFLVELPERAKGSPWTEETRRVLTADLAFDAESQSPATFNHDAALTKSTTYTRWKKQCETFCHQKRPLRLWRCRELKAYSQAGETEAAFRVRLRHQAREVRDAAIEKLRHRYANRIAKIQERIAACEARVAKEQSERDRAAIDTGWSTIGSTLMDALFGRKTRRSTSARRQKKAVRGAGDVYKQQGDVKAAKARLVAERKKRKALEQEIDAKRREIEAEYRPDSLELEPLLLKPRRDDIQVESLTVVWLPWHVSADGDAVRAFEVEAAD